MSKSTAGIEEISYNNYYAFSKIHSCYLYLVLQYSETIGKLNKGINKMILHYQNSICYILPFSSTRNFKTSAGRITCPFLTLGQRHTVPSTLIPHIHLREKQSFVHRQEKCVISSDQYPLTLARKLQNILTSRFRPLS